VVKLYVRPNKLLLDRINTFVVHAGTPSNTFNSAIAD
jgi:hypothetical protein